jgi:hypothetical protein
MAACRPQRPMADLDSTIAEIRRQAAILKRSLLALLKMQVKGLNRCISLAGPFSDLRDRTIALSTDSAKIAGIKREAAKLGRKLIKELKAQVTRWKPYATDEAQIRELELRSELLANWDGLPTDELERMLTTAMAVIDALYFEAAAGSTNASHRLNALARHSADLVARRARMGDERSVWALEDIARQTTTDLNALPDACSGMLQWLAKFRLDWPGMRSIYRGRVTDRGAPPESWAAGFPALRNKPIAGNALKELDRHRERQIRRVARRLHAIFDWFNLRAPGGAGRVRYFGYGYSYQGQFQDSRRKRRDHS